MPERITLREKEARAPLKAEVSRDLWDTRPRPDAANCGPRAPSYRDKLSGRVGLRDVLSPGAGFECEPCVRGSPAVRHRPQSPYQKPDNLSESEPFQCRDQIGRVQRLAFPVMYLSSLFDGILDRFIEDVRNRNHLAAALDARVADQAQPVTDRTPKNRDAPCSDR